MCNLFLNMKYNNKNHLIWLTFLIIIYHRKISSLLHSIFCCISQTWKLIHCHFYSFTWFLIKLAWLNGHQNSFKIFNNWASFHACFKTIEENHMKNFYPTLRIKEEFRKIPWSIYSPNFNVNCRKSELSYFKLAIRIYFYKDSLKIAIINSN